LLDPSLDPGAVLSRANRHTGGKDGDIHRLKPQQISGLLDGLHGGGGNLNPRVRDNGQSRNFVFIYRVGRRQRQMGLAKADQYGRTGITLAQAREKADSLRSKLRNEIDPLDERGPGGAETQTPPTKGGLEKRKAPRSMADDTQSLRRAAC
jgi:hypothetical protein